jgi:hypothetical protein
MSPATKKKLKISRPAKEAKSIFFFFRMPRIMVGRTVWKNDGKVRLWSLRHWFESWPHHMLAEWPWICCINFVILLCFMFKMWYHFPKLVLRIKEINSLKWLVYSKCPFSSLLIVIMKQYWQQSDSEARPPELKYWFHQLCATDMIYKHYL